MTTEQVLTAVGFIGLGTIVPSLVNYFIQSRKSKNDAKHTYKETRYKAITMLCYAYINYEREKDRILAHRSDLKPFEKLEHELHTEWINMALYASDNVILQMRNLVIQKDEASYYHLILAMRKDLYGIRTKLAVEDFHI